MGFSGMTVGVSEMLRCIPSQNRTEASFDGRRERRSCAARGGYVQRGCCRRRDASEVLKPPNILYGSYGVVESSRNAYPCVGSIYGDIWRPFYLRKHGLLQKEGIDP